MPADVLTSPSPPAVVSPAASTAIDPTASKLSPSTQKSDQTLGGMWDDIYRSVKGETEPARQAVERAYSKGEEAFAQTVLPAAATVKAAASVPAPPVPTSIPQPPVPSFKPKPFLSADGKQALPALVGAMGLLATTIMGARNAPQAGLFALTGAMNGWAEGDHIRADRAWREYLAYVDTVKAENDQAWKRWEAAAAASTMNLTRAQAQFAVASVEAKMPEYAIAAAERGMQYVEKDIATTRGIVDMLQRNAEMVSRDRFNEWAKMADLDIKRKRLALEEKKAMDDPALESMMEPHARAYLATGKTPPLGFTGGPLRIAFLKLVSRLQPEYGGPEGVAARQRLNVALGDAQKKLESTLQMSDAFANTARKNLNLVAELSAKVDRTGAPMLNKWLLAGRKAWSGDVDVVNFDAAMRTAITETARVLSSANSLGVLTNEARKEVDDVLNSSFTHAQVLGAITTLNRDMDNRRTSYEGQIEGVSDLIKKAATPGKTNEPGSQQVGTKAPVLIGPNGMLYDGTGVDPKTLKPGWRLQ